jgi:L-alanine-DL-glutamate epimerase-like enolase superfamily enzyme
MLKTAHPAEAFGLEYAIHHSGNSLNNLADLHLCMAPRNTTMFEVLLPLAAHKFDMAADIGINRAGMMHAPTGAGLDLDMSLRNAR